jgi:HAD superfamily hydrolase (TIGR01509 family)
MAISLHGREINAAVFDFDQTLYRRLGESEEEMWGDLRRKLVTNADVLLKQKIADPDEETITKLVKTYVEQAQEIGWKPSFEVMGGSEEAYFEITSSLSIADYLSYDLDLVKLLSSLMQHLPVHVFTGSVRKRVFDALEVLLGSLSEQFLYKRVLAVDDMKKGAKPDLSAYQEMLERFNLKPETSIFIDDQLSEVEAAASLGMITFLIQEQDKIIEPHIVINSVLDLTKYLEIK